MQAVSEIVEQAIAIRDRLCSSVRFGAFRYVEGIHLRELSIGTRNRFYVPVRTGRGRGGLAIGDGNLIGARSAPLIGDGTVTLQPRARNATIRIGARNWISNNITLIANESILIGDGCQIGDLVCIFDSDFHEVCPETRNRSHGATRPVEIGSNVWLGSRVMILKGASVGDNSVVAAGSIVTSPIGPNLIAAGVPARTIGEIER